jgi:hypothetical protein
VGALIGLVIAACGTATVPIDAFNAELARAFCERAVRCGAYDTLDRCLSFQRTTQPITPSVAAAVAGGLVTYDGEQAAACLAERASESCANADVSVRLANDSATCRGVLRAGRPIGEPCAIDEECASRSCGALQCPPGACCQGACVQPTQESPIGEDCTTHACAPVGWCASGLCVPHLPLGAICGSIEQCDFGLDCFDTCQPPPRAGDPCRTLLGTPTCGWVVGLACDPATMTCQPELGPGAACDPLASRCQGGWLHCDPATMTCQPYARVGETCTPPDSRCEGGAFCAFSGEFDPGVCLPFVDLGSPCEYDQQCASGACSAMTRRCIDPLVCT